MNKRIIYPSDDGGVAVIVPAECGLTIEEIAAKDVPPIVKLVGTGEFDTDDDGYEYEITRQVSEPRPFQIVDVADVPSDRTFRNAWEWA